jgi:hypothetical protein
VSWSLRFTELIVLEDGAKVACRRHAITQAVKAIPADERGSLAVWAAA